MSKNILLIAPHIHDFAAYDLWLKPLGLLYVASAAEATGYSVRLINCLDRLHPAAQTLDRKHRSRSNGNGKGKFSFEEIPKPAPLAAIPRTFKRYGIPRDVFRRELEAGPRPHAIGVGSMMTYWYQGVAETIQIARKVFSDVPIILGGIYATLCPDHAQSHSGADYIIQAAGERQFTELLQKLVGPGEIRDHHKNGPAYHLLEHVDSVSMTTSYGCPFACAYCASKLLRPAFRQRPVREVVTEIEHYRRQRDIRDIAFYDDALLVNRENHIKPILRELIDGKINVRLHTPNGLHANMIDEELATLMKNAGFATIRLSVESIDPALMNDSCMKVTAAGFRRGVHNLIEAGYEPASLEAYVLMGMPGQPPQAIEETMRFVHGEGLLIRLSDFSPIPGTPCFEAARTTWNLDLGEPLLHNSSVLPYLVPGMLEQYQDLKALARSLNANLRDPALES
ncbi:MAG: radical SAM protein [Candidatus Abyssobacteria bacterium SURF_5]|uniref:Radical SAM protein n=1 Tax=Abyssobacteria bacterium (strain SURF_5) TaxID=2093360 RepID=A0A3A4P3P8_ABYX5|nr:MAG: radical SAM protein [Candidatus Abyssubacteria bacterium SURF_5]